MQAGAWASCYCSELSAALGRALALSTEELEVPLIPASTWRSAVQVPGHHSNHVVPSRVKTGCPLTFCRCNCVNVQYVDEYSRLLV